MPAPKIKGQPLELNGVVYTCPPLCLDDAVIYLPMVQDTQKAGGFHAVSGLNLIIDVVHAALKRNYPELERPTVSRGLDLGNMMEALTTVMAVSGFRREPKEGKVDGAA